jgi:hypothetical protein
VANEKEMRLLDLQILFSWKGTIKEGVTTNPQECV